MNIFCSSLLLLCLPCNVKSLMVFIFCFLSFRRFGTKCGGCAQGISPNDLVRRAKSKVFHLNCFTCMMCNKQLSTGEEMYIVDEFKFVCKEDYLSNSNGKDTTLLSGMEHNMTWTKSQLGTANPCLYFYIFLKPLVNHDFLIFPIAVYSIYFKKCRSKIITTTASW